MNIRNWMISIPLIAIIWPRSAGTCAPSWAGVPDGDCLSQVLLYRLYHSLAAWIWPLDRALLQLIYQIGQLRVWLIETAFTSGYKALTEVIDPWMVPLATAAILIGCLLFLAMPLLGRVEVINIRQVLVWTALAPLMFSYAGLALADVETFRSQIGAGVFSAAQQSGGQALNAIQLSATERDLDTPRALYPNGDCGQTINRAQLANQPPMTTLAMDDLVATLVYADAVDLFCPRQGIHGVPADLPHRFYEVKWSSDVNATPYAYAGDLGNLPAEQRAGYLIGIQQAINRLALSIMPTLLAVVEAFIQLLLTLSLIAIWVASAFTALVLLFQKDFGALFALIRRATSVVISSWTISFLLGLIFACLLATAESGSASALIGFAIGGLFMSKWLMQAVIETFRQSLGTLSSAMSSASAVAIEIPARMTERMSSGVIHTSNRSKKSNKTDPQNNNNQQQPDQEQNRQDQFRANTPVGQVAAQMGHRVETEPTTATTGSYQSEVSRRSINAPVVKQPTTKPKQQHQTQPPVQASSEPNHE